MKKYLIAGLLAGLAAPAIAADAPLPDVDPAMWVVKDGDTTIYMFGTFHMLDGKQAWFNDEVKTAFDEAQEVVLEAVLPENPAEMQPLIMKYAVDPAAKPLSSKLAPEMKGKLDKELTTIGAPAAAFDMFEPWFVSMTLTALGAQKLGFTGEHGPEAVITKAAKASGKPVSELEGMDFQLSMFDKMPEAQQIALLGQTLDSLSKLGEVFPSMNSAWANGDTDKLVTIMNEGMGKTPELYKVMLTDRNATWADWIGQRMEKPGVVFMAVGAGHLAGKDSVQDYLAKKGLKSTRVKS